MTIEADIAKLEAGALIELFQLDATALGGTVVYFHAGTNGLLDPVTWDGDEYAPYPVQAAGFEITGNGQIPRPKLSFANVLGTISGLIADYDDLLGAKVTRIRTMKKYLDAVNFSGGTNPDADPSAELPREIWFIDRKALENKLVVEFELAASFDVTGVKLPRRQIQANLCPWAYRGTECGYAGSSYWDINDDPVGSLGLDRCGKRLSSCELRFGENNPLPFGGFPAAALIR